MLESQAMEVWRVMEGEIEIWAADAHGDVRRRKIVDWEKVKELAKNMYKRSWSDQTRKGIWYD